VSPRPASRYRITLSEIRSDGTTKLLIEGPCSAYVLAITEDRNGELRVLTDHDGPPSQRRRALDALTAHIRATIGLER
jgi:hypothetical protein